MSPGSPARKRAQRRQPRRPAPARAASRPSSPASSTPSSAPRGPAPVLLERGRAAGILGGLLAFTLGFAVAAAVVLAGGGAPHVRLAGICLGLVGIGLVGYFYHRGSAQLPQARLWSPELLRAVARPLGLPPVPVMAVLYVLGVIGVVGNLVLPMTRRH